MGVYDISKDYSLETWDYPMTIELPKRPQQGCEEYDIRIYPFFMQEVIAEENRRTKITEDNSVIRWGTGSFGKSNPLKCEGMTLSQALDEVRSDMTKLSDLISSWDGNDFEDCLNLVYKTRTPITIGIPPLERIDVKMATALQLKLREHIMAWLTEQAIFIDNVRPEHIFSVEELEKWAENNGCLAKDPRP